MPPQEQKPKSEYNMMPVYVRGDRKYINRLKSLAANADLPLADYIREKLDKAITCDETNFFGNTGSDLNRTGNV